MSASPAIPQETLPRVATVIVNYAAAHLIIANIDSLLQEYKSLPGSHIYIVDNAGPGNDAADLQSFVENRGLNALITVIPTGENGGFAKGNNIAFRRALTENPPPDYFFLLNPDAYIRPGALLELTRFMETNPRAGIAGSRLEGEDGAAQVAAFRFFSIASEFAGNSRMNLFFKLFAKKMIAPPQRDETYRADWICGAAALIRRETLADAGFFDEAYFLYYEETDFMLQAARKNWETWYVHTARTVHLVGQSTGVKDGASKTKASPPYWFRSRRHYFDKNYGPAFASAADLAWLAGSALFVVKSFLTGQDNLGVPSNIKRFFTSRRTEKPDTAAKTQSVRG